MDITAQQKSEENNQAAEKKKTQQQKKGRCYDVSDGVYCFSKSAAG